MHKIEQKLNYGNGDVNFRNDQHSRQYNFVTFCLESESKKVWEVLAKYVWVLQVHVGYRSAQNLIDWHDKARESSADEANGEVDLVSGRREPELRDIFTD